MISSTRFLTLWASTYSVAGEGSGGQSQGEVIKPTAVLAVENTLECQYSLHKTLVTNDILRPWAQIQ